MDFYSRLKNGDELPAFRMKLIDGREVSPAECKGSLILINLFIIKCPHCRNSHRYINKHIQKYTAENGLLFYAIGREHTSRELLEYKSAKRLNFSISEDPDRKIYDLFATQKVPRNYLVDRDGKIIYQKRGFDEDDYDGLLKVIEENL